MLDHLLFYALGEHLHFLGCWFNWGYALGHCRWFQQWEALKKLPVPKAGAKGDIALRVVRVSMCASCQCNS